MRSARRGRTRPDRTTPRRATGCWRRTAISTPPCATPSRATIATSRRSMSSSSTAAAAEAGGGVLDEARPERLARAQGYPYPYPDFSYVYVDGVPLPLLAHGIGLEDAEVDVAGRRMALADHLAALGAPEAMTAARTPLLAYGS